MNNLFLAGKSYGIAPMASPYTSVCLQATTPEPADGFSLTATLRRFATTRKTFQFRLQSDNNGHPHAPKSTYKLSRCSLNTPRQRVIVPRFESSTAGTALGPEVKYKGALPPRPEAP